LVKINQEDMEKIIKLKEDTYRNLVEKTTDGIVIIQDNVIRYSNPGMAKMLGYTVRNLTGTLFAKFVKAHRDQGASNLDKPCNGNNNAHTYEVSLKKKNGKNIYVEINTSRIDYEGKPADLLFVRNIDNRKRLEMELRKKSKLDSLGVLSNGIAHDFNNILAVMNGYIQLARLSMKPGDEGLDLLNRAQDASNQAKELTRKLTLFYSGSKISKCNTSIAELLKEKTRLALKDLDVCYEFSIPDDLWPVEVDQEQMGQVFYNLAKNAAEAVPEGGKIIVGAKNISMTKKNVHIRGKHVRVFIQDKGIGIKREHLEKIFDPYFSTKDTWSKKGMGLGLSLSRSIVKSHGGYIRVESRPGIGSTFHVYLPISRKEPERGTRGMKRNLCLKKSHDPIKSICSAFLADNESFGPDEMKNVS